MKGGDGGRGVREEEEVEKGGRGWVEKERERGSRVSRGWEKKGDLSGQG